MTVEDLIKQQEGCRLSVYEDTLGVETVGYGHAVLPEDDLKAYDRITQAQADAFFAHDLEVASREAKLLVTNFEALSDVRQAVLVSLVFQLGLGGALGFHQTRIYIQNERFADAAEEMLDSLWARQTPERALQMSLLMRTGEWSDKLK